MKENIFHEIRQACEHVAHNAQHVTICKAATPTYAASLPLVSPRLTAVDEDCHYLGEADETAAFFVILDTINFGSGYFPHLKKRDGLSGYFTVASALKDSFSTHGPLTADALASMTVEQCNDIFQQDLNDLAIHTLLRHFTQAWNELGHYLIQHFDGNITALIQAAQHSANQLAHILIQMPSFQDVAHYQGHSVPLYKRAQITAADLSFAFQGKGLGQFDDLDQLTIFADNLVPHVLRVDGILEYSDALSQRIDQGELIEAQSPEEVEIRACAIHAVELILKQIRSHGQSATAMQLDHLLWNRGQEDTYRKTPRHRTQTVFY